MSAGTEDLLMVRALRVYPKLQHPARRVEGSRNSALALKLANIANVEEDNT